MGRDEDDISAGHDGGCRRDAGRISDRAARSPSLSGAGVDGVPHSGEGGKVLKLETRGATSEINAYMEKEAVRILEAAAQMYDVKVAVEKVGGAAGGSNSPALAAYLEEQAKKSGIFSRVVGACDFGASEDFSYFMERVQARGGEAAYMMVGADLAAGHHDSHFTFDEAALLYAVKMMAVATAGLLRGEKGCCA